MSRTIHTTDIQPRYSCDWNHLCTQEGEVKWQARYNEESRKAGAARATFKGGFSPETRYDYTQQTIEVLSKTIKTAETINKTSEQLASASGSGQNAQKADAIRRQSDSLNVTLQELISTEKTKLLAQEQGIPISAGQGSGSGSYGVIVSVDKEPELAAWEVEHVRKIGFRDVVVFERQGWLRTVVRFPDRATAETNVPKLQQYRKTSYAINLKKWCANPIDSTKKIAGVPVYTCP